MKWAIVIEKSENGFGELFAIRPMKPENFWRKP